MSNSLREACSDSRVAVVRLPSFNYEGESENGDPIAAALMRLGRELEWADPDRGPLANVIPRGARVVVKPNFVNHANQGSGGILPLVTHQSLVHKSVEAALQAGAGKVLVGDAPIQSCDFELLLKVMNLDSWSETLAKKDQRFKGIHDFRRTKSVIHNGVRVAAENLQSEDNFVLFDLAAFSLLEAVTDEHESFRVTSYDPSLMAKTHSRGRHQYLVSRHLMEADVVINLPKLKTHKKAGVTCALKNLIGINGNKEYLPHHRLGGTDAGGDCYPGGNPIKRALEFSFDRQNSTESLFAAKVWQTVGQQINRVLSLTGDVLGIEGSWHGNNTIWRTCLDLNRILLYGRADATMADEPQRRVIHIVDAVVAGQGDGPLSPQPLELSLIFAGQNAAAVDWVGSRLLGYDPNRIPIVREAFGEFKWPLTRFTHNDLSLKGDLGEGGVELLESARVSADIIYPVGWADAVDGSADSARTVVSNTRETEEAA
ncbi:MAG: DUF362 domain-containing protein [bacterium]